MRIFLLTIFFLMVGAIKESFSHSSQSVSTSVMLHQLEIGLNRYYDANKSYPPIDADRSGIEKFYTRELLKHLLNSEYGGPYAEIDPYFIMEYQGENLIVDSWERPIIYIPSKWYEEFSSPEQEGGALWEIGGNADKIEYLNSTTFQLRSFGSNGIDDQGEVDDVQNFWNQEKSQDRNELVWLIIPIGLVFLSYGYFSLLLFGESEKSVYEILLNHLKLMTLTHERKSPIISLIIGFVLLAIGFTYLGLV